VMAGVFLFVALSSIGLPGLNGFVGEFLVLLGTFAAAKPYAVAAVAALVLSAVYLLWGYQRLMHGPPMIAGGAVDEPLPAVRGNGAGSDRSRYQWGHL